MKRMKVASILDTEPEELLHFIDLLVGPGAKETFTHKGKEIKKIAKGSTKKCFYDRAELAKKAPHS